MAVTTAEAERLNGLGGRRSARRAVTVKVRTDEALAARVEAAARAAGVTRQQWAESVLRAAVPDTLDEVEERTA